MSFYGLPRVSSALFLHSATLFGWVSHTVPGSSFLKVVTRWSPWSGFLGLVKVSYFLGWSGVY